VYRKHPQEVKMTTRKLRLARLFLTVALIASFQSAKATPGLTTSKSVNDITRMLRSYSGSNISAVNIHEIEERLRDRPAEAGEALINILDGNDEKLKIHASQLLRNISGHGDFGLSEESIRTIVAIMKASDNAQVQANLLSTLGNIGPKNDLIKQSILEAIKTSREVSIRKAAIDALAHLAREEKPASHLSSTKTLLTVLKTDDAAPVRAAAATALGTYRDNPPQAVPALSEGLDDNYLQVRRNVVQALGNYGKDARPAIPKIIAALNSESDRSMRSACIYALRNIDPRDPEVINAFLQVFDDSSIGDSVIGYLHDVGPGGVKAIPKLLEVLRDSRSHRRFYAARALGSMGPAASSAVDALKQALSTSDPNTRRYIEEALKKIQPDTTTGAQVFNP
jgi:HEAT repeat protein